MGPPSEDGGYLAVGWGHDSQRTASMGPPSEDGGYNAARDLLDRERVSFNGAAV